MDTQTSLSSCFWSFRQLISFGILSKSFLLLSYFPLPIIPTSLLIWITEYKKADTFHRPSWVEWMGNIHVLMLIICLCSHTSPSFTMWSFACSMLSWEIFKWLECSLGVVVYADSEMGETDAISMSRSAKISKKQQGDRVPYVKSKSLYYIQVCKLGLSVCPTYWSKWRTCTSVRVEFL